MVYGVENFGVQAWVQQAWVRSTAEGSAPWDGHPGPLTLTLQSLLLREAQQRALPSHSPNSLYLCSGLVILQLIHFFFLSLSC